MPELDKQQALNKSLYEMVEFIHALPLDCNGHADLFECRDAVTRKLREAAPTFAGPWPILMTLFAVRTCEQVIDVLVDLVLRAKCPMWYLTPQEKSRLREVGLSSGEQLLLGRLRERLKNKVVATRDST